MKKSLFLVKTLFVSLLIVLVVSCNSSNNKKDSKCCKGDTTMLSENQIEVNKYVSFKLTTDLSVLTEKEKQMLPLLFEAAEIMNKLFQKQTFGDNYQAVYDTIKDEASKKLFAINYGPWNRLNDNQPFIKGFGAKPAGTQFYPIDMTKEEFDALVDPAKTSLYTIIKRDANSKLIVVPYSEAYKEELTKVSELLKKASELAEDAGLKKYLELRSKDILKNDFYASDIAWMEMKTNTIDFIVGPIENYEDAIYGYKASFESFILVKDKTWSNKLTKYAAMLPALQKELPIEDAYKKDSPGADSDLGAYDAIYYAGDCNAGGKTIAINLPNDEKVQELKGSRRLQLKNSMKAKFDNIMVPIADILIDSTQRKYIKFDSFFGNVMFHEVAHGLGVKYTLKDKKITCREALENTYSSIEECKADILGLWLVTKLNEKGEYQADLMDNYITFAAGIFRSIRFGASEAHGKANLITFNYFLAQGAFAKNAQGTYTVDFEKMKTAVAGLAKIIITIQGDGSKADAEKLLAEKCTMSDDLKADLAKLEKVNIPVDVIWEQGLTAIGL